MQAAGIIIAAIGAGAAILGVVMSFAFLAGTWYQRANVGMEELKAGQRGIVESLDTLQQGVNELELATDERFDRLETSVRRSIAELGKATQARTEVGDSTIERLARIREDRIP